MTRTVRIEKRQRGIFGWIFLILFWGFNALMLFALFAGMSDNSAGYQTLTSEAEKTGYAVGTAIGAGLIVMFWAAGAVILGLFVILTRGKKVIVETVKS